MLNLQDPTLLRQACYIDGAWVGADNGETIAVTNPATGETIATVPRCGAAETERAIAAAVPEEFVTAFVSKVLGEMPIL